MTQTLDIKTIEPMTPWARPCFILVVDDDQSNRDSLQRRLQRRGYVVRVAEDGTDALQQLGANANVDLVLLDVMMPGISGLEVLQKIRQTYSSTQLPVIMATAQDQSGEIVKAFDLGANDYVTKPLDFAVVAARVQTHLAIKRSVEQIVELEQRLNERNRELESLNRQLTDAAERAQHDLITAAKVQEAFLPQCRPNFAGVNFSWVFKPCQELAGDSLNICPLDADHVGLYVLDVSGHGVAASLLAVAVNRAMSPGNDPQSILVKLTDTRVQIVPPSEVVEQLAKKFAWNDSTNQFITLFYAVLNVRTRQMTYVSAGHPGALRLQAGGESTILNGTGLPIGVGEQYAQQSIQLESKDRVYLYSDGVTEAMNAQRVLFEPENMIRVLKESAIEPIEQSIAGLVQALDLWRNGSVASDDISIVGFEVD